MHIFAAFRIRGQATNSRDARYISKADKIATAHGARLVLGYDAQSDYTDGWIECEDGLHAEHVERHVMAALRADGCGLFLGMTVAA